MLEEQVSRLSQQVSGAPLSQETAWWKKIVGVFQDDPEFDEAMRLGRAYREGSGRCPHSGMPAEAEADAERSEGKVLWSASRGPSGRGKSALPEN